MGKGKDKNDPAPATLPKKWSGKDHDEDGDAEDDSGAPPAKSKQDMRDHYKSLGNSKVKNKTQKGGTGHWEGFAN